MNDPWSSLIQTLAGADRVTPGSWPTRRVYRSFEEAEVEPQARAAKTASQPRQRRAGSPLGPRVEATPRMNCPCTNCRLQQGPAK